MEQQIIEQLIELNKKDIFDYIAAIVPLVLTVVIIFQNAVYAKRDDLLQRRIHNRDCYLRYHDDILKLYNSYYDFCDVIFTSNFANSVKYGDTNFAFSMIPSLEQLRMRHYKLLDLAKVIFNRSSPHFLAMIKMQLTNEIEIVDKYIEYVMSESFVASSNSAWDMVIALSKQRYPNRALNKYDYTTLAMDRELYSQFEKLCDTESLQKIEQLLERDKDNHTYSKFDASFEKYIGIENL